MVERFERVDFGRRRVCASRGSVVCEETWAWTSGGDGQRSAVGKAHAAVRIEADGQARVPLGTAGALGGENAWTDALICGILGARDHRYGALR